MRVVQILKATEALGLENLDNKIRETVEHCPCLEAMIDLLGKRKIVSLKSNL